jgi:glyoxylase-like metal-dependent hydrolase (beta-lactamase superfamily II)
VKDFPELAEKFALRADAIVPFRVATSVAVNGDGSRTAFTEYAGWLWVRGKPAIGQWDPPYHLIPFVPRQRGWLRIVNDKGEDTVRTQLRQEGLFDVCLDDRGDRAWCKPASWFARGMAGCAWLPTDQDARSFLTYSVAEKDWELNGQYEDAISDYAPAPGGEHVLISLWNGHVFLCNAAGKVKAKLNAKGPAHVRWSKDGKFAVLGTQQGEVLCIGADGKLRWRVQLPEADLPPLKEPVKRVFDEVPIYQVGRTGKEHAYVGDTWLIQTKHGGVLIDAGGTSAIPSTLQRIKSAGVDFKDIRYLLHSHSHGDHCGAGYLWRSMGLKIVAPEAANFTLNWLMPTLTDYGVWVPRPVDVAIPLKRAGDEKEITLGDLKVKAIFVPGHSFDSVLYVVDLDGKRVVFTGDIGFDNQDILHRCWGDVDKAKAVTEVVRKKLLPLKPDFVFRGHGAKRDGMPFLEDLVKRSEEAIQKAADEKK